jgi:sugar porter (SP) family MFS transporter
VNKYLHALWNFQSSIETMGRLYGGLATKLNGKWLQVCISLSSAAAWLLVGYDQGVFGGLIATPQLLADLKIAPTNADLQSTVVALYDIGPLVGAGFCASPLGRKFGRRVMIAIGCCWLILGASLQAAANNVGVMLAGRLIAGIGTGFTVTMVPIWISETSRATHRGTLITGQMSILLFGLVLAYWFDYGTTQNLTGSVQWRLPLAFQCAFCLICLSTMPFLPESPRFLYLTKKHKEADNIIARIYCVPEDSFIVSEHRREVLEAIHIETVSKFRLKDLFWDSSPVNATWRVWIAVLIQFFQQMSGICLVAYYATYIFINNLSMSQHQAAITSGGMSLLFWGGTLVPVLLVEKVGRRILFLIAVTGTGLSMIAFTVGLALFTDPSLTAAVVFIFLYEFFFGIGDGIAYLYAPEVIPLNQRHLGVSCATFMSWLCTFIVVKAGPVGIQNCGWKIYLWFCICGILQILFVWFCIKETKGLSLEEIDILFAKPEHRAELEAKLRSIEHRNQNVEEKEAALEMKTAGEPQHEEVVDPSTKG